MRRRDFLLLLAGLPASAVATGQAVDFARESDRDIVSVRYSGLIREEAGRDATAFDEIWHLVREHARSDGSWLIAGIQQSH